MYIALILLLLIFTAIAVLVAAGISAHRARRSAAPYYPAPKDAIRNALKEIDLKPGETFYDLGAGTGATLLIAEREFGARATGFEISLLPYWLGRITLALQRSRATLIKRNFFTADLKDADVVFCFLAVRTMQKMEDKIKAGLKPGARIIVYAFPFPTVTPTKTITIHGRWKMFIYGKQL